MKLMERIRPLFQFGAQADGLVPAAPVRRFALSRGILDQIAYPLIDETDDVQVMLLTKFSREIEQSLTQYRRFSICEVRDFMESFKIPLTAETARSFDLLKTLHCVPFDIVPRRLYEQIPHLINHCISCGQITHPLIQPGGVIDA